MQEYGSNNKVNNEVIRSIVFAGDNSQYTGTLYLHPSITKIIFEKEKSVISNISIPEVIVNNGSDKERKPFKLPQSPKMVDIYLPENGHFGTLSISGGILVTLLTNSKNQVYLSFNEIKVPSNTLFVDDRIHITNHHNSNYNYNKYKHNKKKYLLRDINIKGISENVKQNTTQVAQIAPPFSLKDHIVSELKKYIDVQISNLKKTLNINQSTSTGTNTSITTLQSNIDSLQGNINSILGTVNTLQTQINTINDTIYYVINPLILTGKCDAKFDYEDEKTHYSYSNLKCNTCTTPITDQTSTSKPSELFSTLSCNTCKHNFTTHNITLMSWLYPALDGSAQYYVRCSFCHNKIEEIALQPLSISSQPQFNIMHLDYDANTPKYDGKNIDYRCKICAEKFSLHYNKLFFNTEYVKEQIRKQYIKKQ